MLLGIICHELTSNRIQSLLNNTLCPCKEKDYEHCEFLTLYYNYLKTIDFKKFIEKYEMLCSRMSKELGYEIKEVVIIVYEKESNKCSERTAIKKWFEKNRVTLKEMEVKKDDLLV